MPDGFRAAEPPTNRRRLRKVAGHLVRLRSVRGKTTKFARLARFPSWPKRFLLC